MNVKETNKKIKDKIHEKHKFIKKIGITSVYNKTYKKTHEHVLTNEITVT